MIMLHPVSPDRYRGLSPAQASAMALKVVATAQESGQTLLCFEHLAHLIPLMRTDRARETLQRVAGTLPHVP